MDIAEHLSPLKRTQILDGAGRVFAIDGYEGASMARIAAVAAVSKGTLYNYFPSKAALFKAFVAEQCTAHLAHIFDSTDHEGAPADVLRGIGRRMMQMMLSPSGRTIYRVVISEAAKFPDLAETFFDAGAARAIAFMAGWLAEETRRSRLAVPDPHFAAEQFFAMSQTALVLRRRLGLLTEPGPAEIDRVVEAAVTMFLNTYGVRP
jgi:AcrR family transcriptional regulator